MPIDGAAAGRRVNDPARLAAVVASGMLDTPAEAVFDDLARLAARLLGMPLAFVTFVDADRSYWKASIGTGIDAADVTSRQNPVWESFCQYVVASDGPIVVTDAATDPATEGNPSVETMGVRAWAGFPVRSPEGHVLGSFCVVDTSPRTFSHDDLEVLSSLALAASREVALRGAVRQATELAREAELANRRLLQQATASELLGASLDAGDVLAALAKLIVPDLGEWLVVALRGDVAGPAFGPARRGDPSRVVVVEVVHSDPDREAPLRAALESLSLTTADAHGVGPVIATGQVQYLPDVRAANLRFARASPDTVHALVDQVGVQSALTVPLTSRGRVLGAMTVAAPAEAELERELIADLGRRAGVAMDNAVAYGTEHALGLELQRSLMPSETAGIDGIALASRYLPATVGALAGGDFHQVVRRPRDLVLLLGDVEGHGMASAAQMGQLRAAAAALILEGHDPAGMLERLAAGAGQILEINLATLLVVALDPATRRITLASAGHPPAVIKEPGAPARLSTLKPGPPLGVGPVRIPQDRHLLPAGSVVVLYSDGLVERRGEDLDVGLDRLRAAVDDAAGPTADVEAIADHVLAALGRTDGGADDIALLVLR